MTNMGRATTRVAVAVGLASLVAAAGVAATPATSIADPAGHQVTYTVTTQSEMTGNIYYLNTEPPSQSAYDANSSQYLTQVRTLLAPGQPWVYQTTLNDPNQWALVSASGALRVAPQLHCEIAVDGVTVVQQDGASGVQCALRPW
ncbi:MAG: hypothetical protein JO044_18750 [Mycobacteriaceae bacterium]|nr:hypothetical protein [Mycobacteriaceae bacterium]